MDLQREEVEELAFSARLQQHERALAVEKWREKHNPKEDLRDRAHQEHAWLLLRELCRRDLTERMACSKSSNLSIHCTV